MKHENWSNAIMVAAYVLINCDLGSEESVISELNSIDGVVEVHGTFGAYDILAKVEAELVEKLRETITWKIRKIAKIRSTLTLMGIEGQE
jgi:DNA-binding Lrp family transcriptional regulator